MRVLASDIKAALKATGAAVPSRPAAPFLAGVRIVQRGDVAEFSATDWETWVSSRISVDDGGDLDALVSHRTLAAIAKVLRAGTVELTADERSLTVKAGASKWTTPLITGDAQKLPPLPPEFGTVAADALQDAVRAVAPAAGDRDELPVLLTLALAPIAEDRLRLSATDRYRVHAAEIEYKGTGVGGCSLPSAALLESVVRDLSGTLTLRASVQSGLLGIEDARTTVLTRVVDAKPVPIDSFLDTMQSSVHSVLQPGELLDAIQAALPTAGQTAAVDLTVTADGISIVSASDEGTCSIGANVLEHQGKGLVIRFNATFLAQALKAVGGETVRIDWAAPTKPAVITPDRGPCRCVLMPIRFEDSMWLT